MKLNFDFNIPNLDGSDFQFLVNQITGERVTKSAKAFVTDYLTARAESFSSFRAMEIATELHKKGEIDLPESEVKLLEEVIKNQKAHYIIEVPLLKVIEKAKLANLSNTEKTESK